MVGAVTQLMAAGRTPVVGETNPCWTELPVWDGRLGARDYFKLKPAVALLVIRALGAGSTGPERMNVLTKI